MKIEYTVLWFDNSQELFDSLSDHIDWLKQSIAEWGFIPNIILVSTPDEFLKFAPYANIDLVVVDFNLEEFGEGQDFIEKVRSNQVYTEVIFYSAQSADELWETIKIKQLEGIYVANKGNIVHRILAVGEHTLRKVLDLENMRGIVMAEVGDLDRLLEDVFSLAMKGISEEHQEAIFRRFHEDAIRQVSSRQQALEAFVNDPSIEQLKELCDSDKRWSNYNRVKKHHEVLKKRNLGNYQAEVLKPRNFLAHGVPQQLDSETQKFIHRGEEFVFSRDSGRALRGKIIEYKCAFQEIIEALESMPAQKELASLGD